MPYSTDIPVVYQELDSEGGLLREVGLGPAGEVVHRCPDAWYPEGTHGLDYPPEMAEAVEVGRDDFEVQWAREGDPRYRLKSPARDQPGWVGALGVLLPLSLPVLLVVALLAAAVALASNILRAIVG